MLSFVIGIQNALQEAGRRNVMAELDLVLMRKEDVSLDSQKVHFSAEVILKLAVN